MEDTNQATSPKLLTEETFLKYYKEQNDFLGKYFSKIDQRFEQMDAKFTGKFEELDAKFTGKFEELGFTLNFIQKEIADISKRLDELSTRTLEDTDILGIDILGLKRRVEKLEILFQKMEPQQA